MEKERTLALLEELEARLQLLEDEHAILYTMHRYGYCLDYGLEEEWTGLFTDDARYVTEYETGEVRDRRGRDEILRFAQEHTRAPEKLHKHIVGIPFIEVKGDEATVSSYFYRLDAYADGPQVRAFGHYADRMVRRDGKWLFAERIATIETRRAE